MKQVQKKKAEEQKTVGGKRAGAPSKVILEELFGEMSSDDEFASPKRTKPDVESPNDLQGWQLVAEAIKEGFHEVAEAVKSLAPPQPPVMPGQEQLEESRARSDEGRRDRSRDYQEMNRRDRQRDEDDGWKNVDR